MVLLHFACNIQLDEEDVAEEMQYLAMNAKSTRTLFITLNSILFVIILLYGLGLALWNSVTRIDLRDGFLLRKSDSGSSATSGSSRDTTSYE